MYAEPTENYKRYYFAWQAGHGLREEGDIIGFNQLLDKCGESDERSGESSAVARTDVELWRIECRDVIEVRE